MLSTSLGFESKMTKQAGVIPNPKKPAFYWKHHQAMGNSIISGSQSVVHGNLGFFRTLAAGLWSQKTFHSNTKPFVSPSPPLC